MIKKIGDKYQYFVEGQVVNAQGEFISGFVPQDNPYTLEDLEQKITTQQNIKASAQGQIQRSQTLSDQADNKIAYYDNIKNEILASQE